MTGILNFYGSSSLSEMQDNVSKYKDGDVLFCTDNDTSYVRVNSEWEPLYTTIGTHSEETSYKLPERCSNCGGSLADASKYKIGLSQVKCPYCESILNLEKEI